MSFIICFVKSLDFLTVNENKCASWSKLSNKILAHHGAFLLPDFCHTALSFHQSPLTLSITVRFVIRLNFETSVSLCTMTQQEKSALGGFLADDSNHQHLGGSINFENLFKPASPFRLDKKLKWLRCSLLKISYYDSESHLLFDFRCTVQECSGTLMWLLSWCWPLKMTDCQSSRCGTSVLPHHPLKSLRTTQGEAWTVTHADFWFLVILQNVLYVPSVGIFLQGNSVHILEPGWLWAPTE